ncbi:MAG: threonine/serine exporter family protein [Firmicutes bacterium]|nr:threonine/serine exporter family protein [Bacillota bacterium]NLL88783.1 threonine/serine exporter family protein [Bacillota bacterium]
MERHQMGEIIDLACQAGRIILENGGETYRVEDTMQYVCKAFGISGCDCFATPTTIIISANHNGEVFSRMIRIKKRGVDLHKVELVNSFSRAVINQPMTVLEARQVLAGIDTTPAYNLFATAAAAALGTAAFTVIFGGGLTHFLSGILLGAALRSLLAYLNRIRLEYFTTNLLGGAAAAAGGWLFGFTISLTDWWIVTLAAIMQMVPGLIFTNALRDSAAGDLVSGSSRGVEALSIVAALACGAGVVLMLLGRLGG